MPNKSSIKSPKKLIEVALPLDAINKAAAREKSIRHGHPSTLHLWWAWRPLAAARAVIFAQMVNDPGYENRDGFAHVRPLLEQDWLASGIEARALQHVAATLAPEHFDEVRSRRERQVDRIRDAVQKRLVKEINHLSSRVIALEEEVRAGRQPRIQPENLRRRVEELTARLHSRQQELEQQRHIVSATPVIVGGALVVPAGLLAKLKGKSSPGDFSIDPAARAEIERCAMQAVIAHEEALGHAVKDVSADKCGWDITAQPPAVDGVLPEARHIEVKGRAKGADVVIVTRNEICTALNQGDKFWLAIVLVDGDNVDGPYYVAQPFTQEPEPGATAVTYQLSSLLAKALPC